MDWARTWYSLGHEVAADADTLAMHFENGSGLLTTVEGVGWTPGDAPPHDGAYHLKYEFDAYDFRSAEMQARWAARITDAVATGDVDGAFIDGNRGGWGFNGILACQGNKTCAAEMSAGLAAAHRAVATAIGPDKTLISNYPTDEAMAVCQGGMCERCKGRPCTTAATAADDDRCCPLAVPARLPPPSARPSHPSDHRIHTR